jgi:ATP-dependent RNA helicase RhlE
VHRIGRTARAGASGIAISFCDAAEHGALRSIERMTGTPIAVVGGAPPAPQPSRGKPASQAPRRRRRAPRGGGVNRAMSPAA